MFLWGKYNGIPPQKAKQLKIELKDRSTYTDHIMDMRSGNLYDAGGTVTDGIEVVEDPSTGHKYIVVQDVDRVEFLDYTPEIYQMLTTRNICTKCRKGKDNGRLITTVHYSCCKSGWKMFNLSRFVLLYIEFFNKFKNYKTGNITRFVHNIPFLVTDKNIDCGHINAYSWNNCRENIMLMDRQQNFKMSYYARIIQGDYKMFPIAYRGDGQTKILIEWNVSGISKFFICESVDDYVNMQEFAIGKDPITKNLALQYGIIDADGNNTLIGTIPAPKEQAANRTEKATALDRKDTIRAMLNWGSCKDSLIALYHEHPDYFWHWKNTHSPDNPITIKDLIMQAMLIFT